MVQSSQNLRILDSKDKTSTIKNLVSQMKTDSSLIHHSTRNTTSNISNNGNKRDSTDQLLNISIPRDTSMMLNWNQKKSINSSLTDWAIQNFWEPQLIDYSSFKTISSTQHILINHSSKPLTLSQALTWTLNKVKFFMRTLEFWNGLDLFNYSVWLLVHILPCTFHSVWDTRLTWLLMLLMNLLTTNTIWSAPLLSIFLDSVSQSVSVLLLTLFTDCWTTLTALPVNTLSRCHTLKIKYLFFIIKGTSFR